MNREQMILDNMGLVHMVVKRFLGRGYEREELIQVGSIGLVNAVDRYDVKTGFSFSTYAVPLIMGEIQRFLRDDSMVHISRKIKGDARKIAIIREQIEKTENREATLEELAKGCGLTMDEVILAIDAMQPLKTEVELQNYVAGNGETTDLVINRLTVEKLLNNLNAMDRQIITMRFSDEKSQSQVGKELGINQVAVSRREKKILEKLRGYMN